MPRNNPPAETFACDAVHAQETARVDIIALSEKPDITEEDIYLVAAAVTGSEQSAQIFMERPNRLLHDRTPREAVGAGEGRRLMGMLLNAAGV